MSRDKKVVPLTSLRPGHGASESGEPPHNDGMEARIAKIENRLDRVDDRLDKMDGRLDQMDGRLTRVEVKLDHIDKEVGQFKWWVIAQIVAGMLAVLGTGIAIQQMTVASFQGAAQVAKDAAPAAPAPQQPIIINVPAQAQQLKP